MKTETRKGINLYNQNSKIVAGLIASITGAGMIGSFLFNQGTALWGSGLWGYVAATAFAVVGFLIVSYLTDWGWYQTGTHTVSMAISKKTYKSATLTALMIFSVLLNVGRLYSTFFFTYESRYMNADMMIRDAPTKDIAGTISAITQQTVDNTSRYETKLSEAQDRLSRLKDSRRSDQIARDYFTGPTASATELYAWKQYKSGSEYHRNVISDWVKAQIKETEEDKAFYQKQINLLSQPITAINNTSEAMKQDNANKEAHTAKMEGYAQSFLGIIGLGAILWSFLITIQEALAGDLSEDQRLQVKQVGLVFDDMRDLQTQIQQQYEDQLTDTQDKFAKQISKIMEDNKKRYDEFKKMVEHKPAASGSSASSSVKRKKKTEAWSLEVEGDTWYLSGREVSLSDVKGQAYKWKERSYKYKQKGNLSAHEENLSKWERARDLFEEHGVEYIETEEKISYAT